MNNPFAKSIQLPVDYNTCGSGMRRLAREQYVREQGGKCRHCKQPLSGPASQLVEQSSIDQRLFPQGFFNNPIHLHHDHRTGLTIGAVHARCNAWLWQYKGE